MTWELSDKAIPNLKRYKILPNVTDYHATYSVCIGELIDSGFDIWGDEYFDTIEWPDEETQTRLKRKIESRFWYAEIAPRVPGIWRHNFTVALCEALAKYRPWYDYINNGGNPFNTEDVYGKTRTLSSEFPASQLDLNVNDYAANGNDLQFETIKQGDALEKLSTLANLSNVDTLVMNELEGVFSCLITTNLDG